MANRWLFVGGGIETLRTVSGTLTISTATNTGRRTTYGADHHVLFNNSNIAAADFVDAAGAADSAVTGETMSFGCWYDFGGASFSTVGSYMQIHDSSGSPWLAFRCTGATNTGAWYYNSGTGGSPVWTKIGTADYTWANGDNGFFECAITLGSPHTFSWTVNAVQIGAPTTFTQASLTNLASVRFLSPHSTSNFATEIMAAVGYSCVGGAVVYSKPTGAGNSSAWSGLFSAIDDAGIDDADSISSSTAGQRSTFAYSNSPALSAGMALGDIFLYTRARNSGGAPLNVKPVIRTGGADTVGSSFSGIAGGYQTFLTRYSALSETDFNAAEFGVESAT